MSLRQGQSFGRANSDSVGLREGTGVCIPLWKLGCRRAKGGSGSLGSE